MPSCYASGYQALDQLYLHIYSRTASHRWVRHKCNAHLFYDELNLMQCALSPSPNLQLWRVLHCRVAEWWAELIRYLSLGTLCLFPLSLSRMNRRERGRSKARSKGENGAWKTESTMAATDPLSFTMEYMTVRFYGRKLMFLVTKC